jgi:hypothetical protein
VPLDIRSIREGREDVCVKVKVGISKGEHANGNNAEGLEVVMPEAEGV